MRAYARDLHISPSRLSEVMNSRSGGLSLRNAEEVAKRLGLSSHETRFFTALIQKERATDPQSKAEATKFIESVHLDKMRHQLHLDQFEMVSTWYYFALLELLGMPGVSQTQVALAERLGISKANVKSALARLVRLGFLEKNGRGYTVIKERTSVASEIPSHAIRNYHLGVMEKAASALLSQDIDAREFGTLIFSGSAAKIPAMKEQLRKFFTQFARVSRGEEDSDTVFCLGAQLFQMDADVTKKTDKESLH